MRVRASATTTLDTAVVQAWSELAERWLGERRAELDALNVFPVADSDTGTNLYLTFVDAAVSLRAAPHGVGAQDAARLFARGALVGARGNSGVIVGQYVGALARSLLASDVTPEHLVDALRTAADAAYAAVAAPVEGTVLTVARSVVEGARQAALAPGPSAPLAALEHGIAEGYLALGRTTGQLAALRAAGVLDAGAWGLLLVLDALAAAWGSTTAAVRAHSHRGSAVHDAGCVPLGLDRTAHPSAPAAGYGGGEFEVMYLVATDADGDVAPTLRAGLSRVGESVAVVGGDGLWQAHVHTDHPVEATAVPTLLGVQPSQIRVRHLLNQSGVHGTHRPALGLVAVTRAPGLVPDLARAGAVVVLVPPGASAGAELGRAVDDTGAREVLVLSSVPLVPGTGRGASTRVLDDLDEVQVVAGAATVASRPGAGDPAVLLAEVIRSVRAVRTAVVPATAEPDVPAAGHDVGAAGQAGAMLTVARPLLGTDAVLLTVLTAASTPVEAVDGLRAGLATSHPRVEVVVLDGGRPGTGVELGAE